MATRRPQVLLLGAGHAHLQVLQGLAGEPLAGADCVLVTPRRQEFYSGMVPGVLAGHYPVRDCAIDPAPWAAAAGVSLEQAAAVAIDAGRRQVTLDDGRVLRYELLSLDVGSVIDRGGIPGAAAHALFVRPMDAFVAAQHVLFMRPTEAMAAAQPAASFVQAAQRAATPSTGQAAQRVATPWSEQMAERTAEQAAAAASFAVIGGGAAGVELVMALRHRLASAFPGGGAGMPLPPVALVTGGPPPLDGYAAAVRRRVDRALARLHIRVLQHRCARIDGGALQLSDGSTLACDRAIVATGAEAPGWLAGSGLALDAGGFVRTGPTLQSRSHPEVFAAGDVATRDDAPHARSGVHAVRAGPPLLENLRRCVAGRTLVPHRPPRRTLALVSCGAKHAIGAWGGWSAEGRWVWWCKDRIDRAWVARFAAPPAAITPAAGTR